jgi:DNA-binding CsgD family transcriptional regulator
MFPQKPQRTAESRPKTYPLGEKSESSPDNGRQSEPSPDNGNQSESSPDNGKQLVQYAEQSQDHSALALVALSHSPAEQRLYAAMLMAASENGDPPEPLTAKRLMTLTGIGSCSTVRRGLEGLLSKLSIERQPKVDGNGGRDAGTAYLVYQPEEVIARRKAQGLRGVESRGVNYSFDRAIRRVADHRNLSRREAQVALCCVEGLTNAEIGSRLEVTEQTVKFHLRHVFLKFGVKRRAELISKLLR